MAIDREPTGAEPRERKQHKRGQNEGSAYQRKDGRWEAMLTYEDEHGATQRRSFYGKTKAEAWAKMRDAEQKIESGQSINVERQTVAQFLDRWLVDVVKPSVRPKTHHSYAQLVRLHIAPSLGKRELSKLAPQHVQAFMNEKLAAGLSPRTVQYLRAVLRRALGQALKWGLVGRNVATLVDPPKSRRPEVHPLSPDQVRDFLSSVESDRLGILYHVAIASGLRQGELLGLKWEDVDLTAATIRVRHALQRMDGEIRFVEPKTAKSRRTVSIPAPTADAMKAHRDRQAFERVAAGVRWEEWGLVFTTPNGTPLDSSNVTHRLQKALEASGLPRQRFHDLRHCCASLLLAQNVPARVVMEILGHSQISLTMDTYSHVMPAAQREAADRLGQFFTASGS